MRAERNRYLIPFKPIGEYKSSSGALNIPNYEQKNIKLLEAVSAGTSLKLYGGQYGSQITSLTNKKVDLGSNNSVSDSRILNTLSIEQGRFLIMSYNTSTWNLSVSWGNIDNTDENTINFTSLQTVTNVSTFISTGNSNLCRLSNTSALLIFSNSTIGYKYCEITWDSSFNISIGTTYTLDISSTASNSRFSVDVYNTNQIVIGAFTGSTTYALIIYSISGGVLTKDSSEYNITASSYVIGKKSEEDDDIGFLCFYNGGTGTDLVQFTVNIGNTISTQSPVQLMTGTTTLYQSTTRGFEISKYGDGIYLVCYANSASTYYVYARLYNISTNSLGSQNAVLTYTGAFTDIRICTIDAKTKIVTSCNTGSRLYFSELWHPSTSSLSFLPIDYVPSLNTDYFSKKGYPTDCSETICTDISSNAVQRIRTYTKEGIALEDGIQGDTITALSRIE